MGAVYIGCRGDAGAVFGEGVNPHPNPLPQGEGTDCAQLLPLGLPVGIVRRCYFSLSLWECTVRGHGRQVFGDMVNTF